MDYYSHTLPNGIRLIHMQQGLEVAYCGLIINAGSRDEKKDEHGLAHFIEHAIFKGTTKRKAFHILSRLEDVGGELNAYTTKEETSIYATFLTEYFERATELIADITFNSTFPTKELEKEKEVIVDEINSYKDSPSELIFDDFEELLYPNHFIGRNILGTKKTVRGFTRNDIFKFIKNNYNTDQMVFCSVGNINFSKVVRIAEKHFGHIPENRRQTLRSIAEPSVPIKITKDKDTYQSHVMLGCTTYDYHHKNRLGLILLNNILGGPGMNSRLNMSLREKQGITYNVESSYTPMHKTGIFSIYFGTENKNVLRCMNIIHRELKRLKNTKLGSLQLHRAKQQLKGQIAISSENNENLMLNIGKSFLIYNKIDSLRDIYANIDNLSSEKLIDIANEVFDENRFSELIYK